MLVVLLTAALLALSSVRVASQGMRPQRVIDSAWGLEEEGGMERGRKTVLHGYDNKRKTG
jgi:hypothetical protein